MVPILVLINGQVASGKSSTARTLLNELPHSAYIDTDAIMSVNPFRINNKIDALAIKNLVSLVKNYSEVGYRYIIVSGFMRSQKLLDDFLSKLSIKVDVLFVWLRASKEIRNGRRVKRNRDGADKPKHHELIDALFPDVDSFVIKNGRYLSINTTKKTIHEVADEIHKKLREEVEQFSLDSNPRITALSRELEQEVIKKIGTRRLPSVKKQLSRLHKV